MRAKSVKEGSIYLKASDNNSSKKSKLDEGIKDLYKEYIQQLNDDLLERADSFIDIERKMKNNEANYQA